MTPPTETPAPPRGWWGPSLMRRTLLALLAAMALVWLVLLGQAAITHYRAMDTNPGVRQLAQGLAGALATLDQPAEARALELTHEVAGASVAASPWHSSSTQWPPALAQSCSCRHQRARWAPSRLSSAVAGTCTTVALQGRRAMPVELQTLITPSGAESGRRTVSGLDPSRAAMVVAEPTAVQALDSDRVIVKDSSGALSFVGGAQWADRVPALVQARLIQTLGPPARSGFSTISPCR